MYVLRIIQRARKGLWPIYMSSRRYEMNLYCEENVK